MHQSNTNLNQAGITITSNIRPLSGTNQPFSSEQVIEIFQSKYTNFADRKANAIVRFCRERETGFYYEEIANVIKMTQFAIRDLREGVIEMNQALINICQCASSPFKKQKCSDELKFVPLLPGFLDCFK